MGKGMKSQQLTILNEKIKHDDLCRLAAKWLKKRQYIGIVTVNNWMIYNDEKPDVIGFNKCGGNTTLIEVKTSRADFKRDFKKPFRVDQERGMGTFRYYCCPEGIITRDDLPDNWGLLIYKNKNIFISVSALPHREKNRLAEAYMLNYYLRFPDKFKANRV